MDSRAQLDELAVQLSRDGKIFMPCGHYGSSQWFTWLQDRFGLSWQLNLP